jgi:hypothetical protein
MPINLKAAIATICSKYEVEPIAVYRRAVTPHWPLHAKNDEELEKHLRKNGQLLPLPKEPAALANILETSVREQVMAGLQRLGIASRAGTERGYPDIEVSIPNVGFYAIDIKVAKRSKNRQRTQSRITLYTGNTYFRYPSLHWPGTFRPFDDYNEHLDIIVLYNLTNDPHRVEDVQVLVQEPWRIASKKRSSTTREYLGAVDLISDLVAGKGEFSKEGDFYSYWRKFPFKTGKIVEKQLQKALKESERRS